MRMTVVVVGLAILLVSFWGLGSVSRVRPEAVRPPERAPSPRASQASISTRWDEETERRGLRRAVPLLSQGEGAGSEGEPHLSFVQVRFVDGDHLPLPGVELFQQGEPRPLGRSDGKGRLAFLMELAPDTRELVLEARAAGYAFARRRVVREGERPFWLGDWRLELGGIVRGRVLDANGPVAGARVLRAFVSHDTRPWQALRCAPLGNERRLGVETRTDAEGAFELAGVAVGPLRVVAVEGVRVGRSDRWTLAAGEVREGVEVRLQDCGRTPLEVVVLDPDGEPVPHARVHVETGARRHQQSADGSGVLRFELESGERDLRLRADDPDGRYRSASCRRASGSGTTGAPERIVLRLQEARRREVVVVGDDGRRVEAFAYELVSAEGTRLSASPDHPREKWHGERASIAVPDEPFALRLRVSGYLPYESQLLDPEETSIVRCRLAPGGRVEGTVTFAGSAVAAANVSLHPVPGFPITCNGFPLRHRPLPESVTTTDDAGGYVLGVPRSGTYHLVVRGAAGRATSSGPWALEPDRGARIDPVLEEPGGLRIVVESRQAGRELAGHIVGVSAGDGDGFTRRSDPEGVVLLESLRPGPWWVGLRDEELRPGVREMRASPSSPSTGLRTVEVVSGRLLEIRLDLDASSAARCTLLGRLQLEKEETRGWKAFLMEADGAGRGVVGPGVAIVDGAFRLEVPEPGRRRLALCGPAGEVIFAPVDLVPGVRNFEVELERVDWTVPARSPAGEGALDFHEWHTTHLQVLHPLGRAGTGIRVPPGPGRILRFAAGEAFSPGSGEVLEHVHVAREGGGG